MIKFEVELYRKREATDKWVDPVDGVRLTLPGSFCIDDVDLVEMMPSIYSIEPDPELPPENPGVIIKAYGDYLEFVRKD